MSHSEDDDIHKVWQEPLAEPNRVSLEAIRAEAGRFETRTRRWRSVGAVAVIVAVIAECVQVVWPGRGVVERTGDLLTIAAFLYISYEYHKHARQEPEQLGLTNCVQFYRAQLFHEQNLAQQSGRYLLPFAPGVTLSLLGGVLAHGIPAAQRIGIAVFGIALFLGVALLNTHTARQLQKKIDTLDAL